MELKNETAEPAPEEKWACIEIFGHRKHFGKISEVEQFGTKMLRIDVPKSDLPDAEFVSHFYGGASIFGITFTDEASARMANKPYKPYGMVALPAPEENEDFQDSDDGGLESDFHSP